MAVNGQKLLPQGNRGGALAVSRPKVSLVKKEVKKDITSAPDTMLVIKTRVVEIEKILKGSVALDKKIQDQERKEKQKLLRAEEEKELETKDEDDADKKVKKKKSKIKLGFLDGLIKFINDVLMGWLLVRMVDFLPQLQKILPLLGGALDFLTSTVLGIVNVLGTFLMWGDKAISGSRNFVQNIFGEKGAKVFDAIVGTIGNLFNLIAILAMTAGAFGNEWGRQSDKPRGKPRRKPRSLGDRVRRMRRRFQTSRFGRAARRVGKTFNKIKNIKPLKILKKIKPLEKIKNIKPIERLKNVKPLEKIKNIKPLEKIKNIMPKGKSGPGLFSRMKSGAGNLWQGTKNIAGKGWQGAKQLGGEALKGINSFVKNQLANVDNIIGGIKARGAKWAQEIGKNLQKMNPMKLAEKVKGLLKGQIDDILKNNKIVKQVLDIAKNPKKIGDILKSTAKNKNVLKLRETLKVAKKAKIGGVDKVIAAIMGVIDYGLLGESPVNAILRAIGGLLGYTAGFAIGAPFGGAPGFITGMAGGFVGEQAARLLAKGLVHVPTPWGKLGTMDDPIANALGLSPRKIVRDPDDTAMNDKLNQDQQKLAEERSETTKPEKMDKTLKIGKKTFDLSKSMGGLSQEDYDALSDKDRGILSRRLRFYASQNEGVAKIMPVDVNSVAKNTESISKSASYEEGGEGGTVVIVENSSGEGDQQTESGSTVVVGGGSDSSAMDDFAYKGDV